MIKNVLLWATAAGIVAGIAAATIFLASLVVFVLWNWLAVGVFGAPYISLFQAFGLLLVAAIVRNYSARFNFTIRR